MVRRVFWATLICCAVAAAEESTDEALGASLAAITSTVTTLEGIAAGEQAWDSIARALDEAANGQRALARVIDLIQPWVEDLRKSAKRSEPDRRRLERVEKGVDFLHEQLQRLEDLASRVTLLEYAIQSGGSPSSLQVRLLIRMASGYANVLWRLRLRFEL